MAIKKTFVIVLLMFIVVLYINNKNQQIGVINFYTLQVMERNTQEIIQVLERDLFDEEYFNTLIEKASTLSGYASTQRNLDFLGEFYWNLVVDYDQKEKLKNGDVDMLVKLKSFNEMLKKMIENSRGYGRYVILEISLRPSLLVDHNVPLATYYYLHFNKRDLERKLEQRFDLYEHGTVFRDNETKEPSLRF
ncbi:hypothetical protein F8154_07385 [Alkaliphilus pronyensis]|uniref:Uncharacterized protein n=1 Tax=Alkaliphilus pronyensis TaxID=1482732 RepID=A0A6I0F9M3_9FIRM|nr:hypothetical protein [Alkaliphilus pronyensis]KAB3535256.1 hypothetical protein F8154_07385 [Alkaliphilus pronyensis]